MSFEKIEEYSLIYEIGRYFIAFAHNSLFYKQVHVTGLENIPENEAIIFVGNHQNAIMDAMAVICAKNWQPVFLTRSDVFTNPIIMKILLTHKLLPVYRIRDGKESLKKNEEIFQKNVDILKNKKILGLFPEANHEGKRKLRTIHKGISRIAFQAEEDSDFKLNLHIVPFGVNYSNYFNFRSILLLNFGKPFQIADLKQEFIENPNAAHNEVRQRVADGIKPLIINIENDKFYNLYDNLREIYDFTMLKRLNLQKNNFQYKFIADKKLISALDSYDEENLLEMEELNKKVEEYTNGLNKNKLKDSLFEKPKSWLKLILRFVFKLVTFPLFLYGEINNFIPFNFPKLITRKLKDKNFISSITFSVWLFIYPFYYLILFVLAWVFVDIVWFKWVYLLTLPFTGHFAYWYIKTTLKDFQVLRYYLNSDSDKIITLQKMRNEIISKVDEILNYFEKK